MEFNYNGPVWNYDNHNNFDSDRSFFIGAPKKKERIREHRDQILSTYLFWQIIDFTLDIDLFTFDPNCSKINIIGNIMPKYNEKNEVETIEEMASITSDCFKGFTLRQTNPDIMFSIFSKSRTGSMLFITPIFFILLNRSSTVGALTLISREICLKDFLPSCIRELMMDMSIWSRFTAKM